MSSGGEDLNSALETLLQQGIQLFQSEFNASPDVAGWAPGRVNLIGEHTDYNDGFVLPMALPLVTLCIGKKNQLNSCRIVTNCAVADRPHKTEFPLPATNSDLQAGTPKWANYVKGVIANFEGGSIVGFDAAIVTNVPIGGGLSSSASLSVSTYTFLEAITGKKTDLKKKALACKKAENEFANTPCGIMDQFISVLGKQENALMIDCRNLEYSYVPINDKEHVFLVTDSNVHHELSGGEFAARRRTCFQVAEILQRQSLRDANLSEIENLFNGKQINVEQMKRARHVVTEIQRTISGAEALKSGRYKEFGELMYLSHQSLRDDYEVSCKELDELVSIARTVPGVLGSRMTGGGFGGCTVTLVNRMAVDSLINEIKDRYNGEARFYIGVPSSGAKIIELNVL